MTRVVPAPSPTAATPEPAVGGAPACRFCAAPLRHTFVDLGMSPLCESFVAAERAEPRWSRSTRCTSASASVLPGAARGVRRRPRRSSPSTPTSPSYSDSWVEHARALRRGDDRALRTSAPRASSSRSRATTATCCSTSWRAGIPVLGIEPAANVAEAARGARACRRWSTSSGARRRGGWSPRAGRADLLAGNNVLAQVPDLNDFVAGHRRSCSRPDGVVTMEFPHLLRLIEEQPVRHDLPRALLVLLAAHRRARSSPRHGLTLFDVEELPTHGGSLRIYARHARTARSPSARRRPSSGRARARRRARPTSTPTRDFARAGRGDQARPARRS